MKTSGIILAGGRSQRMRTNKALMDFNKDLMINKVISGLGKSVSEIIIVTNEPAEYIDFDAMLVTDLIPRHGPLSGIHAGLKAASFNFGFVVACDMPFLNPNLISYMIDQVAGYDAVVPRIGEYYQPLHALYSKKCVPLIEERIKEGAFKVTSFYPDINIRYVDGDEISKFADINKVFFNINDRDDLAKALKLEGE